MKKVLVIIMGLLSVIPVVASGDRGGSVRDSIDDVPTFLERLRLSSNSARDSIFALDIPFDQEYISINDTLIVFRGCSKFIKDLETFKTLKQMRRHWKAFDMEHYYYVDGEPSTILFYNRWNYLAYIGSNDCGYQLLAAISMNDEIDYGGIRVGDTIGDLAHKLELREAMSDNVKEIVLVGCLEKNKWRNNMTSFSDASLCEDFNRMRFSIDAGIISRVGCYYFCIEDYPFEDPVIPLPSLDESEFEFIP